MTAPPVQPTVPAVDVEAGDVPPMQPIPDDAAAFEETVGRVAETLGETLAATGHSLRDVVQRLIDRHGVWVERVGRSALDGEAAWSWVVAYRREASKDVVLPLLDFLTKSNPGEIVRQAVQEAVRDLRRAAAELPAYVDLPDVTSLYEVEPADRVRRRFLKRAERARRTIRRGIRATTNGLRRLVRRPRREEPVAERRVPLRTLADFHASERFGELATTAHDTTQQALSQAMSRAINALTAWTMGELEVEQALDRPEGHQPDVARERLERPGASAGDGEHGAAAAEDDWTAAIKELVQKLQDGLVSVLEIEIPAGSEDEALARLTTTFRRDLQQAGTFLLNESRRTVHVDHGAPARLDQQCKAWGTWHRRAVNRMVLNASLLGLREELQRLEDQLLHRLAESTMLPAFVTFDAIARQLDEAATRLNAIFARGKDGTPGEQADLSAGLRSLEKTIVRHLRGELRDVPGVVSAHQVLSDPGRPEWDELVTRVAALPDRLALNRGRQHPDDAIDPSARGFNLDLRQIATDALAPPLPQQLKTSVDPLRQRVVQVWDQAATIEDIVHFNISTAVDELGRVDDASVEERPTREQALEHARSLSTEAIGRARDTLRELTGTFAEPWFMLSDAVFDAFHGDWVDLHRRMDADRAMEERLLGYQTRLVRWGERARAWLHERTRVAGQAIGRGWTVLSRRVRTWIRRGQAAVGVVEVSDDESLDTLDAIIDAPRLHGSLPLVYRKLFAFEPLTETALFEGRGRDLVRVRRHFDRWEGRHDSGVVIVSAALGGGRTSFLNLVERKALPGCDVRRLSLDRRVTDESAFAERVAAALGLDGTPTLAQLETRVTSGEEGARRLACLVDNLEHVMHQGSDGTALLERILSFMARTDRVIYWVAAIGRDAWQFASKTTGSATGFVSHLALSPFTLESLTDVMMSRHTRSGISLVFEAPEHPGPILRQRLRRARTEDRQQDILRREFFAALFDASGQNIGLAILYWLRSADFETRAGTLLLRPLQALSFRFLDGFDLDRTFALKAFVLHNTLTVERLEGILRVPRDEAAFILESLLNQRLVERLDEESSESLGVVAGAPYRIRRLLLYPVVTFLRSRHIVY